MEFSGIGAGLGAFAFWAFLAVIITAGIWLEVRKRDAQQETLRRLIESGQAVDQAMVDKLLGSDKRLDRNLRAGGFIVLFAAPGLAILGWFLGQLANWAFISLAGVAALAACTGIGLLVAAKSVERSYRDDHGHGYRHRHGKEG